MRVCLAIVFALAAASAALADDDDLKLPKRMTLEPRQEEAPAPRSFEEERDPRGSIVTRILWNSELEGGAIYTDFDNDLDLSSSIGGYLRYGLALSDRIRVTATYRISDFSNEGLPGGVDENVRIQGFFGGIGYRQPIMKDIDFTIDAAIGAVRWESDLDAVGHDTAPAYSGEAAFSVNLDGNVRLRAGLVVDGVSTEFHQASSESMVNLSYLVGLEIRR